MRKVAVTVAVFLLACCTCLANTYRVRNTLDSGAGSLRQAILNANGHAGSDTIVFASAMAGKAIKPLTPLPALTDAGTTLDGDIDDDGDPDVVLDGFQVGDADGLRVEANNCIVEGLVLVRFAETAIRIEQVKGCTVRSCHIAANLNGTKGTAATYNGIVVSGGQGHTIGGAGRGNIIDCGKPVGSYPQGCGVLLLGSRSNTISNNHFGLNRAGNGVLGEGATGLVIRDQSGVRSRDNLVRSNRFAGLGLGVQVIASDGNKIEGNTFGLAADGNTGLPIRWQGISIESGSKSNTVGGTAAGQRNTFAGDAWAGVRISGSGTSNTRIQGNAFGSNVAGKREKPLRHGVEVMFGSGSVTIGGPTAASANYFTPNSTVQDRLGVMLSDGTGHVISNNYFGILPSGRDASKADVHCQLQGGSASIIKNQFANATTGIAAAIGNASVVVEVHKNIFRDCGCAVFYNAPISLCLGNLSNASTSDDGGNVFKASNTWFIRNHTTNPLLAEGNDFGTTVASEIDAKIYDQLDSPTRGRVDFDPLKGGVHPTGSGGTVAVMGLAAIPARPNVEITFGLSAAAEVNVMVLNIAGRPVASVLSGRALGAGTQRITWNRRSDHGTVCPPGKYIVRVVARGPDGRQAQAVRPFSVD